MDQFLGDTALYVWDIHVDEKYQKKGLGKHLLTLLELIARRWDLKWLQYEKKLQIYKWFIKRSTLIFFTDLLINLCNNYNIIREKMKMISIPVQLNDHSSIKWISRVGKGYAPDTSLLQLVGFNSGMEVILLDGMCMNV